MLFPQLGPQYYDEKDKSIRARMEAAYAGAAALVPDWEAWRMPGALTYKDNAEFKQKLNACLAGEIDLGLAARMSWEYVEANLLLNHVNQKRRLIIERMAAQ